MDNNNLTPESNTFFELSLYLKAWQKETGFTAADFKEAADWISDYFKEHPITNQNANIYMLVMTSAAYYAGKERGQQECLNK